METKNDKLLEYMLSSKDDPELLKLLVELYELRPAVDTIRAYIRVAELHIKQAKDVIEGYEQSKTKQA